MAFSETEIDFVLDPVAVNELEERVRTDAGVRLARIEHGERCRIVIRVAFPLVELDSISRPESLRAVQQWLTVGQGDLHDLSSTGRKTETEVRYIEIAVRSEGHGRWKAEAGRDDVPLSAVIQADDRASVGDEWSRGKEAGKRLQSEQRSV